MPAFPTSDWQFWLVTAIFIAAAVYLAWQIFSKTLGRKGKPRKATLTIAGKPVGTATPPSRITKS